MVTRLAFQRVYDIMLNYAMAHKCIFINIAKYKHTSADKNKFLVFTYAQIVTVT